MERELKIRLMSLDDYERVAAELGPEHGRLEQVNSYLDTAVRALRSRRIMARIRSEGGPLVLTVKWKARHEGGYFQAEEEEAELESRSPQAAVETGEAERAIRRLCPEVRDLDLGTLGLLGSIRNLRRQFRVEDLELELDRSRYDDGAEDYELELETADLPAAERIVEALLGRCGARAERQKLTKFERFMIHAGGR